MDIKQLKPEIEKYIAAMADDGKKFTFFAMDSAHPGITNTSFVIKVKGDWIDTDNCKATIDYMVDKLFETMDSSKRVYINSIEILNANDEVHGSSECLILQSEGKAA